MGVLAGDRRMLHGDSRRAAARRREPLRPARPSSPALPPPSHAVDLQPHHLGRGRARSGGSADQVLISGRRTRRDALANCTARPCGAATRGDNKDHC